MIKQSNKTKLNHSLNRPRLYIFKSNKHIYAQIIDNRNNKIITSSATICKNVKQFANCQTAKKIGHHIAEELKNRNIETIVFDCGKHKYHGQVKALAEGTREKGINF
uniref:Large ribosomal subunit protein uL18c n=1 Tax=Caloglossa beccarii TaxID=131038 RepID=A0A1Z1M9B5_9FLOR|nr:ribosomal protein L18 [Caloglossa beccarii]ARW62334.1 ribosomal protein L18 [Caloglossa beccarii]